MPLYPEYITNAPLGITPCRKSRKRVRTIENKRQTGRRTETARARNVKNSGLYQELIRYQEQGVELWLNGRRSTSYQIASSVCETTNYMRDYRLDRENQICGISFDRIRNENHGQHEAPCAKNLRFSENFLKKSKIVRSTD